MRRGSLARVGFCPTNRYPEEPPCEAFWQEVLTRWITTVVVVIVVVLVFVVAGRMLGSGT